jgi:hypothetical protein
MPGSIKIDDGSGNYTILTNAGSLGSDKTLTIPNETATLATTNGITGADHFRLNTSLTASANPIGGSNFDRNDAISGMTGVKIGTGMSVDSTGHWTFPETGIWLVSFNGATSFSAYSGGYIYLYGTVDNGSNWTLIQNENSQGQTNYDRGHPRLNALLDIQDTSNYKVYFRFYDEGSATLQGSSSSSATTVEFIRLGDT